MEPRAALLQLWRWKPFQAFVLYTKTGADRFLFAIPSQGNCVLWGWRVAACVVVSAAGLVLANVSPAQQQRRPLDPPIAAQRQTPQHHTRLILKDGSYQTVLGYTVVGNRVHYRSAERNGEQEDLPLALVDLPATQAWERAHDPNQPPPAQPSPVLSPELAREEAARAARTPLVATAGNAELHLPEDDSVLVLDTFQGTPELVPLPQQGSDLNRETAHAVLKKEINPAASPHDLLFLKGERADVQLHVADPVFFVRLEGKGDAEADGGGSRFTVDTQGQAGRETPGGGSAGSTYVIERVDVRRGQRAIESPLLRLLGSGRRQPDVLELNAERMPGGLWMKLTPKEPLAFGEYVLLEVLNDRNVNAATWDFGVHPTAKENDEALRPEAKRPARLERR